MSDKQLALRHSSSELAAHRAISPHDDLEVLVDQLLRRNEGESTVTVDQILGHPQVKKHGMLGRLSSGQQSLVTSVVSLMQDKVASDARKNADALKQIILQEREALGRMSRSFAETAKHLYQLPLISRAQRDIEQASVAVASQRTTSTAAASPPAPPWERFLTWGNLLAVTAIVLAGLVVKTSVETASYETQYRLTSETLEQTRIELAQARQANEQLSAQQQSVSEQNAALTAKLEAIEKQSLADKDRYDSTLKTQSIALAEARQTLDRQQSLLSKSASVSVAGQNRLAEHINTLQQQLVVLKARDTQLTENVNMWKQLAEERKVEIGKLQNELHSVKSVSEKTPENKASFLGFF